jgi:phospholipid/cholesterol/gamma-HCH transport system permease protein
MGHTACARAQLATLVKPINPARTAVKNARDIVSTFNTVEWPGEALPAKRLRAYILLPSGGQDAKTARVTGAAAYDLDVQPRDGTFALTVRGRIEIDNAQQLLEEISTRVSEATRSVVLDLSGVDYFDSGGAAVLLALRQRLAARRISLEISRSTPAIEGFLSLVDQDAVLAPAPPASGDSTNLASHIGAASFELWRDVRELTLFTGELMIGLWQAVTHPRQVRWRDTWLYMERAGLDGVPIVMLISFLMGLITAFQAAVQLTQFGADIYIANLVSLSITRELGPLMTAIIAAGRSGAAFAAEIGTMKVSEEVDALTTMGFDRTRFLVVPKVLSLLVMLPCLTLIADLVGVIGGLFVAVFQLDLPVQVFLRQTRLTLTIWDVTSGLIKSVVFAYLISAVGCLRGFQASSGAESVGRITTSAIVASIFMIILADAVFTVVFNYW